EVVPSIRQRISSICAAPCSTVTRSFLTSFATWPSVTLRASSRPAWTRSWSMSLSTTGNPAAAIVWAICPPIVPAPTTAALNTNISRLLWSNVFEPSPHVAMARRRMRRRPARTCAGRNSTCSDRGGLLDTSRQQRFARDDETLDLRGALVQLHDLGIAEQLLHGVLLDEAVAAVDLDGVGGDLHRRIGSEALGVRGDERVALTAVQQVRRLPGEQAGSFDFGGHVGDHELDRLVHRDRHAELDAFARVVGGELEGGASDAGCHRGDARTGAVERHHRELEARVFLAEQVLLGDLHVVEGDSRGVGRTLA